MEGLGVNPLFWKNKKVLITGHTGFQGSWLCLFLQSLGAQIIGYSLPPPTEPSLFEQAEISKTMLSLIGDIRHLENLKKVIFQHKPEIILHLAAQALMGYSYHHPVETYETNILGTVHLLESVRGSEGVRAVVMVTSDKCYENKKWVWGYRENDPLGGADPYSSSKGSAELIISAFRDSYFRETKTAIASARAGNVIGGGDWAPHRLVPDIMKALLENQPICLRSPEAVRPWQHVLEALHGYLCLAEKLHEKGSQYAEGWNFGRNVDENMPVSWITEKLIALWGNQTAWVVGSEDHPPEDTLLKLDSTKAKAYLGWEPMLSLSETLEWIVEWYRFYQQKKNIREITEAQIQRFKKINGS